MVERKLQRGSERKREREWEEDGEFSLVYEWSIVPHIGMAREPKWIFIHWSFTVHSLNDKTKQIHSGDAYELIERDYITENQVLLLKFMAVLIIQKNLLQFFYQKWILTKKNIILLLKIYYFQ